jgi:hypothetical protein
MALEQLIPTADENARIPDEAKIHIWIRAAQKTI